MKGADCSNPFRYAYFASKISFAFYFYGVSV